MIRACWLVEFKNKTLDDEILNALIKVPFFDGISYAKENSSYEFKVYLNSYLSQDSFIRDTIKNLSQNNSVLFKNKKINITDISNINWLKENYKLFKPVEFDNFVFFGDHIDSHLKYKKNMISLNSSDAFGSGSHPTTKGCLYALKMLQKKIVVRNFLDIGCGTGILSICGYKYWHPSRVIAVDIDKNSLIRSELNSKKNMLINKIKFELSDGNKVFRNSLYAKFDLVVANILSSELIKLAQDISKYLKKDSFLILSGILKNQSILVINKFRNFNLILIKKIYFDDWVTIIMVKKDKS
jgi:ribosomal protein L11 methyltransferase